MYYFLPHKLALLMLIILLGSSSIALKGEGYSNAITKENIFTSKNILPVDKAFQLDIKIHDRKILLEWKIDENCYMYRDKFKFTSKGKVLDIKLPRGNKIDDPFFGEMEVFYNYFDLKLELSNLDNLEIEYQGCHKKGYCYTPVKKSIGISALKNN